MVQAIGKRVLEGKIDQLHGKVTVFRCATRAFSHAQWADLARQLSAWRDTVARVRSLAGEQRGTLPVGLDMLIKA